MKKKVWIISEIFYPEESATSHILTGIAKGLENDYWINVITGQPDYTNNTKVVRKEETFGKVTILRCFVPHLNKNKIVLRIARAFILSLAISYRSLTEIKKGDAVIVVTNPVTILFFMSVMCRIKKTRFVIIAHDIFPYNMVPAKIVSNKSLILSLLKKLSILVYCSANKVIVIGRDMRAILSAITGRSDNIEAITNWADCENVYPLPYKKNKLISDLQLEGKFVVGFVGNIGRVQGVEYLIAAMERLSHEGGLHFIFVGDGAKKYLLEEKKGRGELTNLTLLGNRPRDEQIDFLNAFHVGLISLSPGMLGLGVPSKAYNIMAAGKPIVAMVEKDSEIGLVVAEENIGWVTPPGDPSSLVSTIIKAKNNPVLLEEMGRRARNVAQCKYSYESVIGKYKKLLDSI